MASANTDLEFIGHDIIKEVMKEYRVNPMDVPDDMIPFTVPSLRTKYLNKLQRNSKRYFCGHSPGTFAEHGRPSGDVCERTWQSGHTWCVLDLKEQAIIYRFTQKCWNRKCIKEKVHVKPSFDDHGIRNMAEWAVEKYLIRCGLRKKDPPQKEVPKKSSKGPHGQASCQMCRLKRRKCWLN